VGSSHCHRGSRMKPRGRRRRNGAQNGSNRTKTRPHGWSRA